MHMPRKKVPSETFKVDMGPVEVPVDVYYEYRNNVRVAQGKRSVLLRIPILTGRRERDNFKQWCVDWMHKQWRSNARFRTSYFTLDYSQLGYVSTYDRDFQLVVEYRSRKTVGGQVSDDNMEVYLPADIESDMASVHVYNMIHKLVDRHYRDYIVERLYDLHGGAFSKPVTSVSLKNMSSKWGSCSNTGRMSLSTRLLFAPKEVQDYVMIHELCHLDQLNHSQAFWDLVELYDPLYDMKEKWLKEYGHLCDVGMRPADAERASTGQ